MNRNENVTRFIYKRQTTESIEGLKRVFLHSVKDLLTLNLYFTPSKM